MISDSIFEKLQADVLAVLQASPHLDGLQILADDKGDIQARVSRALGTAKDADGRRGLVIVVLQPEVVDTDENLPGPPLTLGLEIRTLENVLRNRNPDRGTGVRASVAAVRVLAALHHRGIGAHVLYAAEKPILPLDTEDGYVEYAVKLRFRPDGIAPAEKVSQVQAEMGAGETPMRFQRLALGENVSLLPAGASRWTTSGGTVPFPSGAWYDLLGDSTYHAGGWKVVIYQNGVEQATAYSQSGAASPELATWSSGINVIPEQVIVTTPEGSVTLYMEDGSSPPRWSTDAGYLPAPSGDWWMLQEGGGSYYWGASKYVDGNYQSMESSENEAPYPYLADWPSGVSITAPSSGLTLTCATAGASIRYTTDGGYPSPADGTLYTAPITGLAAGTIVRAAAYATALNPGDCTEILITE